MNQAVRVVASFFAITVGLLQDATEVRADFVVSTINFLANTDEFMMGNFEDAAGILRFDEHSGIQLTAGDVPPVTSQYGPLGPTDVAVGPNGNIFVSDPFSQSILHFDGKTGAPIPSPFGEGFPDGQFTGVNSQGQFSYTSLAFGSNGDLYAAVNFEKTIHVYGGPNSATPGIQIDTLLDSPSEPVNDLASIAFDNDGNLLVSDRGNRKIYRVDTATDVDSVIIAPPSLGEAPFAPAGMAVGPNDDIFVVDLFGGTILRYDSNGENGGLFATIPVLPEDTDGGSFPSDIVFDSNGDLLVAVLGGSNVIGSGAGRVLRIDPTGTIVDTLADSLTPASGIAIIDDLAPGDYDGNGTVELADYDVWIEQFGSTVDELTAGGSNADGNGDGLINAADYTVWRDTLGATGIAMEVPQAPATIPEPTSLLLAAIAVLGMLHFRPSRVHNAD